MRNMYTRHNLTKVEDDDHFKIAQMIAASTIDTLMGVHNVEVLGNKPSSKFFVGTLSCSMHPTGDFSNDADLDEILDNPDSPDIVTSDDEDDDADSSTLLMGSRRITPKSIGLRFLLSKNEGKISIEISFDVWKRAIPVISQFSIEGHNEHTREYSRNALPKRWIRARQIRLDANLDLADLDRSIEQLNDVIHDDLDHVAADCLDSVDTFRVPSETQIVPLDEVAFKQWSESYPGTPIMPSWNVYLEHRMIDLPDGNHQLDIRLVNNTEVPSQDWQQREGAIFCPRLRIDVRSAQDSFIRHHPEHVLAADVRYEPLNILADGLVCVAEEDPDAQGVVETVHSPVFSQGRLDHTDYPETGIEQLLSEPHRAARAFHRRMIDYVESAWSPFEEEVRQSESEEMLEYLRGDLRLFHNEIDRIDRTVSLLDPETGDKIVIEAFNLMMETITSMIEVRARLPGAKRMDRFYPFQLGFLLATIPDIVERRASSISGDAERTFPSELIWFPTGGGKTEAFQSLAVFTAFHDRLTGKPDGVNCWLMFALRALTVQQTQRLLEIVWHAERVRERYKVPGIPFRVGFLVGSGYSPNDILADDDRYVKPSSVTESKVIDEISRDDRRYVYTPTCPECGNDSVRSSWSRDSWNIMFRCTSDGCHVDEIPVTVVDDDIRRFPPAFLVSTIDKITAAGLSRKFHSLLRTPVLSCPVHGFVRPFRNRRRLNCGTNHGEDCEEEIIEEEPRDSGPSLIVIDEVHLLEEELGTFSAHYLSLLREIQTSGLQPWAKIVLASATMSETGERESIGGLMGHTLQLTGIEKRRFPSPPLTRDRSFYFSRDKDRTQRFFVGIHPHAKTENDTIIHCLKTIHSIIQDLRGGNLSTLLDRNLSPREIDLLLRPYETTIDYVLALRQADGIKHSIEVQLREYMRLENREPIVPSEIISSRLDAFKLSELLQHLDNPEPVSQEDRLDTVPASSSIAYGVDIRNINIMLLVGQPRRTSEDIQVTSRTGRKTTGLVFRLFHPVRQRDLTHYLLFHNYHHNQDLLVDDIPLNRFSTRSVRRTIPGILMGLLYNTDEDRNLTVNQWKAVQSKRYLERDGSIDQIVNAIDRILLTGIDGNISFDNQVRNCLEANLALILNQSPAATGKGTPDLLQEEPMKSLRDVDPGITLLASTSGICTPLMRDSGLTGTRMNRTRIQVILGHCPGATFEYRGGHTIVRSTEIIPDPLGESLLNLSPLPVALKLYPLMKDSPTVRRQIGDYGWESIRRLSERIQFTRPTAVYVDVFPYTLRCLNQQCRHVWTIDPSQNDLTCPNCSSKGKQLRHVAIHGCGTMESLYVPRCPQHQHEYIMIDDAPQEVSQWQWTCTAGDHYRYRFRRVTQYCQSCSGGDAQ